MDPAEVDGFRRHEAAPPTGPLRYVDEGDGPPVVLVHGSPVSAFAFRHQVRSLSDAYRVIAPDLPTFGRSEGPEDGADFPTIATALVDLLDELDITGCHLLGHDWGGPVAGAAAIRRPDAVQQLVLVNSTLRPDFSPPLYWRPFVAPWVGELLVVELDAVGRGLGLMLEDARQEPARSVYRQAFRRKSMRRTVLRLERQDGFADLLRTVDRTLPTLDVDLALLWGHPDEYFRASELARLRERYSVRTTVELHGAGHFPMADAPDAFTRGLWQCLD